VLKNYLILFVYQKIKQVILERQQYPAVLGRSAVHTTIWQIDMIDGDIMLGNFDIKLHDNGHRVLVQQVFVFSEKRMKMNRRQENL